MKKYLIVLLNNGNIENYNVVAPNMFIALDFVKNKTFTEPFEILSITFNK